MSAVPWLLPVLAGGSVLVALVALYLARRRLQGVWVGLQRFALRRIEKLVHAVLILLVAAAAAVVSCPWLENLDCANVVLTSIFGAISALALLATYLVLSAVRDQVLGYLDVGSKLERIIQQTANQIFILSENPAFLQAVSPDDLRKWLGALQQRLDTQGFSRVVLAYVHRGHLVGTKFPQWAQATGTTAAAMSRELWSDYTLDLSKKVAYGKKVFLIPLDTTRIPFYVAVADKDKAAMFCHSAELDPNPWKWELRGFVSSDPSIVAALREVFLKYLQLNGAVYAFKCDTCIGAAWILNDERDGFEQHVGAYPAHEPLRAFLFDHDLVALAQSGNYSMPDDKLEQVAPLKCPGGCGHEAQPELMELEDVGSLSEPLRDTLFLRAVGEEWKD